mmetsp:Transcript_99637/g.279026  ORF Transcript_99637/g.279026 Transcript_99637/m.279026 type:complete len:312 (+) Transcript_99637:2134-3069(+)
MVLPRGRRAELAEAHREDMPKARHEGRGSAGGGGGPGEGGERGGEGGARGPLRDGGPAQRLRREAALHLGPPLRGQPPRGHGDGPRVDRPRRLCALHRGDGVAEAGRRAARRAEPLRDGAARERHEGVLADRAPPGAAAGRAAAARGARRFLRGERRLPALPRGRDPEGRSVGGRDDDHGPALVGLGAARAARPRDDRGDLLERQGLGRRGHQGEDHRGSAGRLPGPRLPAGQPPGLRGAAGVPPGGPRGPLRLDLRRRLRRRLRRGGRLTRAGASRARAAAHGRGGDSDREPRPASPQRSSGIAASMFIT